jgi:RND family efflux transporter MFP subunit
MRGRTIAAGLGVVAVVGAVGGAAGWQARAHRARPSAKAEEMVVTTTAKRQDLLFAVTQTGVIAARKSTPVVPELSGRIQWVCEDGIVVAAGDTILRLDPTKVQEDAADLAVRYDEAKRRKAQADAVGKARMKEMKLRLQRAEDDVAAFERQQAVDLRQASDSIAFHAAELERRRQELEVKQRLAAKGLIAGTEVEREQAGVRAAEFALTRERSDYELKKSQAAAEASSKRRTVNDTARDMMRARTWSERDVRMTGNEVDNLKLQLERAQADLGKTTLTAPVPGLVMLQAQGGWRGEARTLRMGDWVMQGREVAQIIGLGQMQVKLELDQSQITGVRMGQAAQVSVEALPGQVLQGKVTAIGQTARRPPVQGWMGVSRTATFPVTIDLPPSRQSLIRPGMRASVRIVSRRIPDAILVPSGCIFRRDGRSVVFVQRNGAFALAEVRTAESNGEYTAITRGLKAGDRIALNDLGAAAPAGARAATSRKSRPDHRETRPSPAAQGRRP